MNTDKKIYNSCIIVRGNTLKLFDNFFFNDDVHLLDYYYFTSLSYVEKISTLFYLPETELWSNREIQLFAQSLVRHEKDFFLISRDLHEQYGISKSVKACVEFYYLWKMSGSEDYRRVRHQRRKKNREAALSAAPPAPACPPGDMDSQVIFLIPCDPFENVI